jgi:hypothetical protein
MTYIDKAAFTQTSNFIEKDTYRKLKALCPNIAELGQGEFTTYKIKGKNTDDLTIGYYEKTGKQQAIYEIYSKHEDTKMFTKIEVNHKEKTANAIVFEKIRNGKKQMIDATKEPEDKLKNLLYSLTTKGYKPENVQSLTM